MECRICLFSIASDHLVSINKDLLDKITYCTSVKIKSDDRLPSHMCLSCVERLNISCDFKVLCVRSANILVNRINEIIPSIKIENLCAIERSNTCGQNFPPSAVDRLPETSAVNCVSKNMTPGKDEKFILEKGQDKFVNHVDVMYKTLSDDYNTPKVSFDLQNNLVKKLSGNGNISDSKSEVQNIIKNFTEDIKSDPFSIQDRVVMRSKLTRKVKLKMKTFCRDGVDKKDEISKSTNCNKNENQSTVTQRNRLKLRGPAKEQCFTCGKIVSSKFRLKMHLRTHTGEKPFNCRYCKKTFGTAQNLKVHERVHTGEKPLLCVTCGKGFAQSAGLVAHMRLHTGEMPYKCALCSSSFRTPGHLQYHIKQHTGEKKHECPHCKKAFISRGDLTQHIKTHTGERPFVCNICGFSMARSGHLYRHMMIHTGEKPHKCHTCDTSFVQKVDLVRHMKKHSKTTM